MHSVLESCLGSAERFLEGGGGHVPTWITGSVYDQMHESVKVTKGKSMWEQRQWTPMKNLVVYRSNWWWPF